MKNKLFVRKGIKFYIIKNGGELLIKNCNKKVNKLKVIVRLLDEMELYSLKTEMKPIKRVTFDVLYYICYLRGVVLNKRLGFCSKLTKYVSAKMNKYADEYFDRIDRIQKGVDELPFSIAGTPIGELIKHKQLIVEKTDSKFYRSIIIFNIKGNLRYVVHIIACGILDLLTIFSVGIVFLISGIYFAFLKVKQTIKNKFCGELDEN